MFTIALLIYSNFEFTSYDIRTCCCMQKAKVGCCKVQVGFWTFVKHMNRTGVHGSYSSTVSKNRDASLLLHTHSETRRLPCKKKKRTSDLTCFS